MTDLIPHWAAGATWDALMSYERPQCNRCVWSQVSFHFQLPGDPIVERCGFCWHTRRVEPDHSYGSFG